MKGNGTGDGQRNSLGETPMDHSVGEASGHNRGTYSGPGEMCGCRHREVKGRRPERSSTDSGNSNTSLQRGFPYPLNYWDCQRELVTPYSQLTYTGSVVGSHPGKTPCKMCLEVSQGSF